MTNIKTAIKTANQMLDDKQIERTPAQEEPHLTVTRVVLGCLAVAAFAVAAIWLAQ